MAVPEALRIGPGKECANDGGPEATTIGALRIPTEGHVMPTVVRS